MTESQMSFQLPDAQCILSRDRYLNKPALAWNARELMAVVTVLANQSFGWFGSHTVNQNQEMLN